MAQKSKTRKITLERVIGTTTSNAHQLSLSNASSHYAYLTGACITITDYLSNKQVKFLISKCEITSISFNALSDKIASGDSSGELTCWMWKKKKKLWKVEKAHKGRIVACEFDKKDKHLVTIGEDMIIKIWSVESGDLIGANRISPSSTAHKDGGLMVRSVTWTSDSKCIVTVGDQFVKYWYMNTLDNSKWSKAFNTKVIEGRKASLCDVENQDFVSVASPPDDPNFVYAVTKQGTLCSFGLSPRSLHKWVNLKTRQAFSIHVTEKSIICGCADGVIRVFSPKTLAYQGTIPKPPPIHSHLTAASINENVFQSQDGDVADAVACRSSFDTQYVAAVYSDRSFIMWDISNLKRISKYRSFLSHGGCIWDVDVLPDSSDSPLPEGTFVTCSEDGTLRFWNINHDNQDRGPELRASIAEKSIFSRDLLHVVSFPRSEEGNQKIGIRCCKFLPSGCHVVSGDRIGNVRVHDVFKFNSVSDQCAHDAEVLAVDATQYEDGSVLIASGSRDNLIHLYDFSEDVGSDLVETLNNHTASITSVKFSCSGTRLMSCSADKTIIFRSVTPQGGGHYSIVENHVENVTQGKIYDMDSDATQKYIITAGSDKKLHIWNIQRGKSIRNYQADKKAEPLKVRTDPAGIHAVTSSSDKILRLYDFYSGACYAKFRGHSGVINGIRFTNDCRNIISVGSDGCILIWKLGSVLRNAMELRMSEIKKKNIKPKPVSIDDVPMLSSHSNLVEKLGKASTSLKIEGEDISQSGDAVPLILSDTNLPAWARPKTTETPRPKTTQNPVESGVWAQRMGAISLRPNATMDIDVQSLHSMSQKSSDSLGAQNVQTITAEEDDDVNLSEDDSDSEKDEEATMEDEERVVFANPEEDKDGFHVASADNLPSTPSIAGANEEQSEEQLEALEPLDDDVAFPDESFDEENIRFVNENYANLDKPMERESRGVRESFSAAFFRQSILQMKEALGNKSKSDESESQPISSPKKDTPSSNDQKTTVTTEQLENNSKVDELKTSPLKVDNEVENSPTEADETESIQSEPGELALEAGYGRVSNDTFGRNFRAVAGELDPLPKTPSDDDEKSTESTEAARDELRFLRKKYKFPTSISMSLKTQKARNEANKGLEEYMRRCQDNDDDSTLNPAENDVTNTSPSQNSDKSGDENTHEALEEEETSNKDTVIVPPADKISKSENHDRSTAVSSDNVQSPSPREKSNENVPTVELANQISEKFQDDDISNTDNISQPSHQDKLDTSFEEKNVALASSPPSQLTPSQLTPSKQTDESNKTPNKMDGQKASIQVVEQPFPLPPRTPDVGQYTRNGNEISAPRALHAFTPMTNYQRGQQNKVRESIILKKSIDEYKVAIENLKKSFQTAISLYDEANTELQRSRLVFEIPKEEEKPVTDILEGFENVFRQLHSNIDQRNTLRESTIRENMDTTLEKYSDMLVNLVAQKMKKQLEQE